ncbi:MAG: CPBP family intramembrane metalloprotease [Anaerolineales bacterium]|nr:CPBP family intramembrane metalloprotease [Anaerolineales bacterium]
MSAMTSTFSDSKGITGFIRRNPLISMYIIMFTVAWSVMIPQALYSQGILSAPLPEFIEILTGWVPGIAALIVSMVIAGRAGARDLFRRFLIWRVGLRWYVISAFLLAGLILGGIGLHVLFGGAMPVIPATDAPLWQVPAVFLVFVLLGFLINTEEVAWRGFALPRLQSRYGALGAALLIAAPEVIFHLPVFWVNENPFFQTVGVHWFSAFSVAAVIVYIYVFNMTKGSLLIVTLLHASQNAWANLLSDNSVRPFQFTVLLIWLIALGLILVTRGKLGNQPDETTHS